MLRVRGRIGIIVFLILLGFGTTLYAQHRPSHPTLLFGIHPYLHATTLAERFAPLITYLEQHLEMAIELRVGKSYDEHLAAIEAGQIDFAYLGPASYVELLARGAVVTPLVKTVDAGQSSYRGVIFVRDDSGIKTLQDIKGKRFAFGDPRSTMSSLVPIKILERAGITLAMLEDYRHFNNHNNVALNVLSGNYDAGAVKEEIFRQYRSRGLKAIAWTPPVATHLFVATRHADEILTERINAAFQGVTGSDEGVMALKSIQPSLTGVEPVMERDYRFLQELINK